eukprot:423244-Amphidinium_carterae.1
MSRRTLQGKISHWAQLTSGPSTLRRGIAEAWAQDVLSATSPIGILQANKPLTKLNLHCLAGIGGDQHRREGWKHARGWEEVLVAAHVLHARDELFGNEHFVELDSAVPVDWLAFRLVYGSTPPV